VKLTSPIQINAALLAIRILGTSDMEIRNKMVKYMKDMESEVLVKAARLEEVGFEGY
jgi:phosphoribosylaminoimidazole carboxylase